MKKKEHKPVHNGTSITVKFVAPGIYTFTNADILYYILFDAVGMSDYGGWNILRTYDNTVSIKQFANNASEFANGKGAYANYRELASAISAFNNGTVMFGTLVQELLG